MASNWLADGHESGELRQPRIGDLALGHAGCRGSRVRRRRGSRRRDVPRLAGAPPPRTSAAPRTPADASTRPRDAATRSAGLRGHVPSVTEPLRPVREPRPAARCPTQAPTIASVTQWKSSDTIAAPVATGPTTLSSQNPRCTRGGQPVLDGLPAGDPPHQDGVGHVSGGERRAVGVEEEGRRGSPARCGRCRA